jgi:hypothetical protein
MWYQIISFASCTFFCVFILQFHVLEECIQREKYSCIKYIQKVLLNPEWHLAFNL